MDKERTITHVEKIVCRMFIDSNPLRKVTEDIVKYSNRVNANIKPKDIDKFFSDKGIGFTYQEYKDDGRFELLKEKGELSGTNEMSKLGNKGKEELLKKYEELYTEIKKITQACHRGMYVNNSEDQSKRNKLAKEYDEVVAELKSKYNIDKPDYKTESNKWIIEIDPPGSGRYWD